MIFEAHGNDSQTYGNVQQEGRNLVSCVTFFDASTIGFSATLRLSFFWDYLRQLTRKRRLCYILLFQQLMKLKVTNFQSPKRFLLTKSQAFDFFNVTKKGILRIITIFDNSYQRIVESPILFETSQCCLEAGLRKV